MRLPYSVFRPFLLSAATLAFAATCAFAAHVAPVLPLASLSNHEYEKFSGNFFPAADLTGIDLSFADLSNCTFASGTNLTNANFTGARMVNCSLSGCTIDNAIFRGADLTNSALPCGQLADFRGAILTGASTPLSCSQCQISGNFKDACTVGNPPALCLTSSTFRGIVAGVVFVDANSNGILDYGEAGVPGVTVVVTTPMGTGPTVTDGRGAYYDQSNAPGASQTAITVPPGQTLNGSTVQSFDLTSCRSGQVHNYAFFPAPVVAKKTTFGKVKLLYR